MKNKLIKVILLNKIENINILTNTIPESTRLEMFPIYYKSSNRSKYKFFELVFP